MGAIERQRIKQCWQQDKARYPKHAALLERSIWAVRVLRFGQYGDAIDFAPIRLIFRAIYQPLSALAEITTGIGIPKSVQIGPGLRIFHTGGIVIHEHAKIGAGFTLRHGVTIGMRTENGGIPVIGDNVDVGAGAMVLGDIKIGDNAKIGAGALVQIDVPENGVAYAPRASLVVKSADETVVSLASEQAPVSRNTVTTVPIQWSRPSAEKHSHDVTGPPR